MMDFIVIPARARLSVSYTGEYGAEGFLGLRRLWVELFIIFILFKQHLLIIY